jgi:hypothetical protein
MPVRVRLTDDGSVAATGAIQQLGDERVFLADIAAGSRKQVSFQSEPARKSAFHLVAATDGVRLEYSGQDLGRLTWSIVVKRAKGDAGARGGGLRTA